MLFRCLLLLFCIAIISAQKGGRRASASETSPVQRAVQLAARKGIEPQEEYQQVQEPDRDPAEDVDAGRRVRPQPDGDVQPEAGHAAPEPYSFSYAVEDPESGAASSREETQDANGEIVGYYHIRDQDGRTRRVDYTAGKDGFKATIKSNEEGLSARQPADVRLELSSSPSERVNRIAPNNRPLASETSLKSFGRPSPNKFYQNLIPTTTTTRLPPPTAPQPQPDETQEISQLTQHYQDEEDEQHILAARPFESVKGARVESQPTPSTPARPLPRYSVTVQQQPITAQTLPPSPAPVRPTQRPITVLTPIREQTYREQGLVNLQPIQTPFVFQQQTQYEDDLNQVQEPLEVLPQPPPQARPLPPSPRPQPSPPVKPSPTRILIPSQPPIRITSTDPFPPLSLPPLSQVQTPRQSILVIPPRPPASAIKRPQTLQTIRISPPSLPTTSATLPPPSPTPPEIEIIENARSPSRESIPVIAAQPPPPAPLKSVSQPSQQVIQIPISSPLEVLQQIQQTREPSPTAQTNTGTFFLSQQHREPITQQQLLEIFQPLNQQQLVAVKNTPQNQVLADGPQSRPISLYTTNGGSRPNIMTFIPQSLSGLQYIVHREQDTYQLPVLPLNQPQVQQQQPIIDDNVVQQEHVKDEPQQEPQQVEQIREEPIEVERFRPTPPSSQQSTVNLQTLPSSAQPLPQPQQLFEPQVYEPQSQLNYDPSTQQHYEQQLLDSVFRPTERCQCAQQTAEQTQISYGVKGAQSASAPLRELPPSPASNLNLYLPKAFRSRRHSSSPTINDNNSGIEDSLRAAISSVVGGANGETSKVNDFSPEARNTDRS